MPSVRETNVLPIPGVGGGEVCVGIVVDGAGVHAVIAAARETAMTSTTGDVLEAWAAIPPLPALRTGGAVSSPISITPPHQVWACPGVPVEGTVARTHCPMWPRVAHTFFAALRPPPAFGKGSLCGDFSSAWDRGLDGNHPRRSEAKPSSCKVASPGPAFLTRQGLTAAPSCPAPAPRPLRGRRVRQQRLARPAPPT